MRRICSVGFCSTIAGCLMLAHLVFFPAPAFAQDTRSVLEQKRLIRSEMLRYNAIAHQSPRSVLADDQIDVKYYLLDLHITASPQYLRGRVVMNAVSTQAGLDSVVLDLMRALTVDSVRMGGQQVAFRQDSATFTIFLDRGYNPGELISTEIFYEGVPGSSGFGSFEFSAHGASVPWVWTLSEPYGAKDWWPCKDHPADKADSTDMYVTIDSSFRAGSNGTLQPVIQNADGTVTYHWQERHPISTYLVSLAITNYAEMKCYFDYAPGDSMLVLNYVLPEHLSADSALILNVLDGLRIYSGLFGLYPFIDEKYGHSEFGWGGGMEHQTMTSVDAFSESLLMHELAHQWFGDMITCRTWPNIWLNEGFATFCEAVYEEHKYGENNYWAVMNNWMNYAKSATGSVYVNDSSDVGTLFDGARVYAKGASALHMLRHVLGDSVFFQAMYNYAHLAGARYNTAATSDFESVCEATSGKDLSYFFNEWICGLNYPQYTYSWSQVFFDSGATVTIHVHQTTGTPTPSFFTMPVDFRFSTAGWDTTITLWNDSASQTFTVSLPKSADSVQLDPQHWILRDAGLVTSVADAGQDLPKFYSLGQNYPNPWNPSTTITYTLPERSRVSVKIYNTVGQLIATLENGSQFPGRQSVVWNNTGIASGVYFYRFTAVSETNPSRAYSEVRKMTLLK